LQLAYTLLSLQFKFKYKSVALCMWENNNNNNNNNNNAKTSYTLSIIGHNGRSVGSALLLRD